MPTSTERLKHGHFVEDEFEKFMNRFPNWKLIEKGQRRLSEEDQMKAREVFVPFESKLGDELKSMLPASWLEIYQQRLSKEGIPNGERFVSDFSCHCDGWPVFDAEIKSEMMGYPNITFELSGYLWSKYEQAKHDTNKVFIFAVGQKSFEWFYLFLDQIPEMTTRVMAGKDCAGSGRPFGLIPKSLLTQKFEHLLWYYETLFAK